MGKTIAKIIAYVLIALALVATVGLIYKFTNGFNEDFKTFYVEYDGKKILTTESKLTLKKSQLHTFTVKYTFDSDKTEPKDYKVKITPNVTRDFDYTVAGERYLFSKTGELTQAFGLNKEQTQFSLTLPKDFGLKTVLQSLYGGKTVVIPEDAETSNPYPYRLTVSSYNDKVIFRIDIKVSAEITDITLDKDEIVFGGGEPETPVIPTEHSFSVDYILSGDASNLSDLRITGTTRAKAERKVNFGVYIGDDNYSITAIRIEVINSSESVEIIQTDESYSFTTPQGNVYVWIYFEYNAPPEKILYRIGYDVLGSASGEAINLDCPSKAAADEAVTFTATIKPEYASEYKISRIAVQLGSGEEYIGELQGDNGTYTFTMPNEATMEAEINEGYITLMLYIIPLDM